MDTVLSKVWCLVMGASQIQHREGAPPLFTIGSGVAVETVRAGFNTVITYSGEHAPNALVDYLHSVNPVPMIACVRVPLDDPTKMPDLATQVAACLPEGAQFSLLVIATGLSDTNSPHLPNIELRSRMMNVNYASPVAFSVTLMEQQAFVNRGLITIIGSNHEDCVSPAHGIYRASKLALWGEMEAQALERARDLTILNIAPGWTEGPRHANNRQIDLTVVRAGVPTGDIVTPSQIGRELVHLVQNPDIARNKVGRRDGWDNGASMSFPAAVEKV